MKNHFKFNNLLLCKKTPKAKSYCRWSVTITSSETVNLDQSECRKINSHLKIYTKQLFQHSWKLEKLEILLKQLVVFTVSTCVDITVYQHGKCF